MLPTNNMKTTNMQQLRWKVGSTRMTTCQYKGVQTPLGDFKVLKKQHPYVTSPAVMQMAPQTHVHRGELQQMSFENSGETGMRPTQDTTSETAGASFETMDTASTSLLATDVEAALDEMEEAVEAVEAAGEAAMGEIEAVLLESQALDDLCDGQELPEADLELSSPAIADLLDSVCMEDEEQQPATSWFGREFDGSAAYDFFSAATSAAFWTPILAPAHPANYAHVAREAVGATTAGTSTSLDATPSPAAGGQQVQPPPHEAVTPDRKSKMRKRVRKSRSKTKASGPMVFEWLQLVPTVTARQAHTAHERVA